MNVPRPNPTKGRRVVAALVFIMRSRSAPRNQITMTSGAILPQMLAMAAPLALSNVLQVVFNSADMAVVGNWGSEHSLAAVGATNALVNLTVNLFVGLSIGANALVSRQLGAGDEKRASQTVHASICLGAASGLILTAIGLLFARRALIWMQSPVETLELSTRYLRVYFSGMTSIMIFNFASAILRAKGDTRRPLFFLALSGVVNVFLNLLFVIAFHMDVAGVALATIISQTLAAVLVVRLLMRETGAFHLDLSRLRLDRATCAELLKIGVPAGFQGIVFSLSNVVIQSSVNGFGETVMAGSAAAQQLEGFVWLSMNAFTHCALSFVSQNLGARQYKRIDRSTLVALACAASVGAALGNLFYLCGDVLLGVFDQRVEVIASGKIRLFWVCCFYWTCGLMDCIVGSLRGMGSNVTPTLVSLVGACGLRIVWIATVFQIARFHTESGLFVSYPISWLVTFLVHCACYVSVRRAISRDAAREIGAARAS